MIDLPPKKKRIRKNQGRHPKPGERRMTPEEKAEIARRNGRLSPGGPVGPSGRLGFPAHAVEALQSAKFRVKPEYKQNGEAVLVAGYGMSTIVRVMLGKMNPRKAPSALKAAIAARAEICEAVVTEQKVNLQGTLSAAVAEASKKIDDKEKT